MHYFWCFDVFLFSKTIFSYSIFKSKFLRSITQFSTGVCPVLLYSMYRVQYMFCNRGSLRWMKTNEINRIINTKIQPKANQLCQTFLGELGIFYTEEEMVQMIHATGYNILVSARKIRDSF